MGLILRLPEVWYSDLLKFDFQTSRSVFPQSYPPSGRSFSHRSGWASQAPGASAQSDRLSVPVHPKAVRLCSFRSSFPPWPLRSDRWYKCDSACPSSRFYEKALPGPEEDCTAASLPKRSSDRLRAAEAALGLWQKSTAPHPRHRDSHSLISPPPEWKTCLWKGACAGRCPYPACHRGRLKTGISCIWSPGDSSSTVCISEPSCFGQPAHHASWDSCKSLSFHSHALAGTSILVPSTSFIHFFIQKLTQGP